MFAMAVWDSASRSLTLIRDRFGVKPLYYARTARGVAFASEIKALVGIAGGLAPTPNTEALSEYLAFGHVLEPRTLYAGIQQLPAGHFMRFTPGCTAPRIFRYWDEGEELRRLPTRSSRSVNFGELFSEAVRRRLVSDVPLGSFNSGGIDSSLVTREVRRQTDGRTAHLFDVVLRTGVRRESIFGGSCANPEYGASRRGAGSGHLR